MSRQDQHWQTHDIQNLNFTDSSEISLQSHQITTRDECSPNIIFTPALSSSTSNHGFDFNLDATTHTMPSLFDSDAMVLDPTGITSSRSLMGVGNPDRINRLIDSAPPWNPQSITSHPGSARFITKGSTISRGHGNLYGGWRPPPPASNPESHVAPVNPHASFFGPQFVRGTRSVVSGTEVYDGFPDDNSGFGDLADAALGMNLNGSQLGAVGQSYNPQYDALTDPDLLSPRSKEFPRKNQDKSLKRTHFCDFPNCDNAKGFSSSNDLDRHKKSVHKVAPTNGRDKSWACQGANCKRPGKHWPRLDNFKNHCKKCHPDENLEELIRKSELKPEDIVQPPTNSLDGNSVHEQSAIRGSEAIEEIKPLLDQSNHRDNSLTSAGGKNAVQQSTSTFDFGRPSTQLFDSLSTSRSSDAFQSLSDSIIPANTYSEDFLSMDLFPNTQSYRAYDMNTGTSLQQSPAIFPNYTISGATLQDFSVTLSDDLSRVLGSNNPSIKDTIQATIDRHIQQLIYGGINPDDLSTGSPDTNSTAMISTMSGHSKKEIPCGYEGCTKRFNRNCDLKKHRKRHSRPYYCTWENCVNKKAFGSKADWKRHETSLHIKNLLFHCQETNSTGEECGKEYSRSEPYGNHLKKDHSITSEHALQLKLQDKEVVEPPPTEFWCGFCKKVFPITGEFEEPLNERFDHIEEHFKRAQTMSDWTFREDAFQSSTEFNSRTGINAAGDDHEHNTIRPDSATLTTGSNESLFDSTIDEDNDITTDYKPQRLKRPRAEEPDEERKGPVTRNRNHQTDQWLSNNVTTR